MVCGVPRLDVAFGVLHHVVPRHVLRRLVEALEVGSAAYVDVAAVDVVVPVEVVPPPFASGGSPCARAGTFMSSLY